MSREVHVPFYERLGVQFPRPTHRFDPLVHSPGCARNPWRYTSVLRPAVGNTLFVFALP